MENKKIEWENQFISYELKIRNVGKLNPSAQIQMVLNRWKKDTERSLPIVCIDIPSEKVASFMEALREGGKQ